MSFPPESIPRSPLTETIAPCLQGVSVSLVRSGWFCLPPPPPAPPRTVSSCRQDQVSPSPWLQAGLTVGHSKCSRLDQCDRAAV